jgi:hypothetical protein
MGCPLMSRKSSGSTAGALSMACPEPLNARPSICEIEFGSGGGDMKTMRRTMLVSYGIHTHICICIYIYIFFCRQNKVVRRLVKYWGDSEGGLVQYWGGGRGAGVIIGHVGWQHCGGHNRAERRDTLVWRLYVCGHIKIPPRRWACGEYPR